MKDIDSFIEKNKKYLKLSFDSEGKVSSIESLVPSEELNFYKTNCRTVTKNGKTTLITKDGESFGFKSPDMKILNKLQNKLAGAAIRNFRFKKLDIKKVGYNFSVMVGSTRKISKTGKFINPFKKSEPRNENIVKNPSPLGDYNTIKASAEKLITKLEKIFKAIRENEKLRSDKELTSLLIRYEELKNRFENGLNMHDTQEILNSKVKLVSLSGRVIARMKNIENPKLESGKQKTEYTVEDIPEDGNEKIREFEEKAKEEPIINEETGYPFVMPQEPVKTAPIISSTDALSNINLNDMKDVTPVEEVKEEKIVSEPESAASSPSEENTKKTDEERKQNIIDEINKAKSNVDHAEGNVKYYEGRIKEVEEMIKNDNLDSKEIKSYESVKADYKIKLDEAKVKLEETKKAAKEAELKLSEYMKEKVVYYVDGKPYKTVTRTELEEYEKMDAETSKRKEDYIKQKDLLEERKELERKLKENMEALKALSTFDESLLQPKEEPSIEEIQETVRRFHQ